jgi:arylsulfatase A-like enzyme
MKKKDLVPLIKGFLLASLSIYFFFHYLRFVFSSSLDIRYLNYQALIVLGCLFLLLHIEKINFRSIGYKAISLIFSSGTKKIAIACLCSSVLINLLVLGQKLFYPPSGPNVLLIVTDALRADHLGCYGYNRPTSPNIDKFAEQSLLFEKAMSNAPWTKPSIASIFTSLYPHEHKAFNWPDDLDDACITLAEIFQNQNYTTFSIQANEIITKNYNFNQGFQSYEEMLKEKGEKITAKFADWLKKNKNKTFFCYLHYMEPHLPYNAPEEFNLIFEPIALHSSITGKATAYELRILNEMGLSSEDKQHLINLYDAEIRYFDSNFKTIFENLKKLGIFDRTLIILTADHGEEFWDHNGFEHGHTLYNELLHVPLIMKYSSHLPSKRLSFYVQLVDLFPTILSLSKIQNNFHLRGQNLIPNVLNDAPLNNEIFLEALSFGAEKKAIIKDGWKLIENTGVMHKDSLRPLGNFSEYFHHGYEQIFEIYNIHKNFSEDFNLINDPPQIFNDLKRRLSRYKLSSFYFPHQERTNLRKKPEDLKSLGYIK